MKKYKYTATFIADAQFKKESFANYKSTAAIEELTELEALLPGQAEINDNPDLLFFSCNLAVANLINLNGHGVDTKTATSLAKYWKHRPVNIEHRRDNVVGYLLNSGYSSFPENKLLSDTEVEDTAEPFNICVGGLVWKAVDPWFAMYMEESTDPDGYCFKDISTSWEIGFDEFHLVLDSKNLTKAEIISDPDKIEELKDCLRQFGGSGFTKDNREIYMLITGNVRPLGIGLVRNPAAPVSGIKIAEVKEEKKEQNKVEETLTSLDDSFAKSAESLANSLSEAFQSLENVKNIEKIISQKPKIIVKRIKPMKFKDLDEFCDMYVEASTKNESIAMSDMRDFIKEQILKKDDEWKAQVAEKEQKTVELQAAVDAAKENAKELEKVKAELAELQAKQVEAEVNRVFDVRMGELNEKYDLSAKVAQVIAKSIRGKSNEDYASWLENEGEVILAGKEKKNDVIDPADAVKTATASIDHVPNASDTSKLSEKKFKTPIVSTTDGKNLTVSFKQSN